MWRVLLVILVIAGIGGINYVVIESLRWLGYFQTIYNHAPGICRKLHGTEDGSEDIHLLSNGIAFISSGLRVENSEIYNSRKGKIYLFDMTRSASQPDELRIDADSEFRLVSPHGISAWGDPARGSVYLYVISHHPEDVVDKFLFEESSKKLTHHHRIANEHNFIALNDLALVDNDQFYFTNMWKYHMATEMLFRFPFGSVGFYDGVQAELIETDLSGPNGIAVSNDGKFLYVALYASEEIRVYSIRDDKKLTFNNSIKVSTPIDNLFVHPTTGDIWFGASPVRYRLLDYFKSPAETAAPSQVMRVTMSSPWKAVKVEEIYSNDGTAISASSVAVVNMNENAMLIGTVASDAYYCQL